MEAQYEAPKSDIIGEPQWKRSRFLTIWLWFMLVMQAITVPTQLFFAEQIAAQTPKLSVPIVYGLCLGGLFAMAFIIVLLRNRRWGYWGMVVLSVFAFAVNFPVMGLGTALAGLGGLVILTLAMFLGGDNSAWKHYR